ncbi:ATP-binding protein [Aquibacillus kalidii]|uniref:ATP-binding protein n=1 Tax=Aquibacillus kalidii TaxID=2762597 RepID=UPI0016458151|nr:ATP-binding protein [Aquibacillus kalidii]
MLNFFRKTIRRQFFFLIMAVSFITFIGVIGLFTVSNQVKSDYLQERSELSSRVRVLQEIQNHINEMVVHMRGYAAFGNQDELQQSALANQEVNESLDEYRQLDLTVEETEIMNQIEAFQDIYWNELLKVMQPFIESNDYTALKEASASYSSTEIVNGLLHRMNQVTEDFRAKQKASHDSFLDTISFINYSLFAFLILIFIVLSITSRNLTRMIVNPISELSTAAEELAKNKRTEIKRLKREDELGTLSNSFAEMAGRIIDREENLSNQNQRLKKQRKQLETTKRTLERLNHMNHALSVTQDQQQLLDQVIKDLVSIYKFNKGILFTLDSESFSSVGVKTELFSGPISELFASVIQRLQEEKHSFVTERKASKDEQGFYHSAVTYDFHAPIFDSNEKLNAVLSCSRIDYPFTEQEVEEIIGILNRVSISLEKIAFFEQTENSRKLNQDIIDNINEGIQFVDEQGNLVQYNEKWLEFFGLNHYNETKFVKDTFQKWMKHISNNVKDKDSFSKYLKDVVINDRIDSEGTSYQFEVSNRILVVYAEAVFRQEQRIGTLLVYRDITAEYEVDQMKSNLVSTVSHELRTPLASVLGYTELMINKDLKPERQERYLKTIHGEAKRLTNLINDFLDLQRMESGQQTYNKQQINVVDIADELKEIFEVNNPNHTIKLLNHSTNSLVYGDTSSITQLYTNLLSNAIKFSPEGGDVIISFNNNAEQLFIHISDEGIGIPEYELKRLFTKFHRIDNSSQRKIGGTGLGLAICKEIVEAHQGKIAVRSEMDKGSVFTVTLPLDPASITWEGDTTIKGLLPEVILVEDDQSLSHLLEDELKDTGFYVKKYNTGELLLEDLDNIHPDGFVIDIMLGDGIDGWKLIETLRKHEHLRNIPIFISSALEQNLKSQLFKVEHYLTKPYPPNKLSTVILHTLLQQGKNGQILFADEE